MTLTKAWPDATVHHRVDTWDKDTPFLDTTVADIHHCTQENSISRSDNPHRARQLSTLGQVPPLSPPGS